MSHVEENTEMDKRVLALALAGDPIVLIDNVKTGTALGWPSLDGALTGTTFMGRILGVSEVPTVPIEIVWYATGNNLTFQGDLPRRCVPMRLVSEHEKPQERTDFRISGDLMDYVKSNRASLVVAALTILRGYVLAGRPVAKLTGMDYPPWCNVVRQAVYWATGVDPCGHVKMLDDSHENRNQNRDFVHGWAELPGAKSGLTVKEALKFLENTMLDGNTYQLLREAVENIPVHGKAPMARDGVLPNTMAVGKYMSGIRDRCIDGLTLKQVRGDDSKSKKSKHWRVV